MNKNNYEINVLVNGRPVREYYHNGQFYIEARQNYEYTVKIKNHSHKKIMAVLSVDGIDVLKGKSAIDAESGYIISPYSSTEIKGYRIDDNNIATFKFDDGKKSYSTQVEQKFDKKQIEKVEKGEIAPSKNNGVIGVRIWEEKEPMVIPEWTSGRSIKNNFYGSSYSWNTISLSGWGGSTGVGSGFFNYSGCSVPTITGSCIINAGLSNNNSSRNRMLYASDSVYVGRTDVNQFGELRALSSVDLSSGPIATSSYNSDIIPNYTPNFELGTTWGEKQEDKVVKVQFVKAETYIDLELFYLTREELIKLGIDIFNAKKVFISGYPKAFDDKDDYCKEPINWRKQ